MKKYNKYKPSNFRYINSIPIHWFEKRAKFIFREIDERSLHGNEELLSVSHYTGVTPRSEKNVNMFLAESYKGSKLCKKHDLVINIMWAWMGALGVSFYDGIVSNGYGVYRFINKGLYNPKYIDYLLRTKKYVGEYIRRSKGIHSSRWRLYTDNFFNIYIISPPLKEQTAIVSFLDHKIGQIDTFINKKQTQIDLFKEYRTAIINEAVTKGLNPNVKMKDSGIEWLGEIPEHWNVTKLKYFSEIINGSTPKSGISEYWNGDIVWLTPDDLGKLNCKRISDSARKITEQGLNSCGTTVTPPNSIIFSTRAPIGHIGISDIPSCTNQGCKTIVPNHCSCDTHYVYYSLYGQKEILQSLGQGSTFTELPSQKLKNFKIPFSPPQEQKLISNSLNQKTNQIDTSIEKLEKQIQLLQQYRTSLISEVVTGKIDVRDEVQ